MGKTLDISIEINGVQVPVGEITGWQDEYGRSRLLTAKFKCGD
ncbi:MAG: hypothetical protein Q4A40_01640 [Bacillota bacterium]|nr:hypothetical protein [Bacillota bacterium]